MDVVLFIALCFSGIFTFAFGLAWFLPLFLARKVMAEERRGHEGFLIIDLFLVIADCIPIFWLINIFPSSEDRDEIRRMWREEKSIRSSFRSFLINLGLSIVLIVLLILI